MLATLTSLARRLFSPGTVRAQGGSAILALAVAGLIGTTLLALPFLARATNDFQVGASTAPSVCNPAAAAAEHGLWRIENDPVFLASMTGTPPTAIYTLSLTAGDATVNVTSESVAAEAEGISAFLTVTPNSIIENTPTTVSYTLLVINNDNEEHVITRAEADPRAHSPVHLTGTTTGMTTADPIFTAGRWRWFLAPGVTIAPFGGQATLEWQATFDEGAGNYWTGASIRVENVGSVSAPMSAAIRVDDATSDVDIVTSVTPSQVSAGSPETFTYTLTATNNGVDTLTAEWFEHAVSRDLDYDPGSTSGISAADPQISHDVINDRSVHRWGVNPTTMLPGVPITLSFTLSGALLPGTIFAVSSMRTVEDTGPSNQPTVNTGETAPITAVRAFHINATINGCTVDIDATLGSTGIEVISWVKP